MLLVLIVYLVDLLEFLSLFVIKRMIDQTDGRYSFIIFLERERKSIQHKSWTCPDRLSRIIINSPVISPYRIIWEYVSSNTFSPESCRWQDHRNSFRGFRYMASEYVINYVAWTQILTRRRRGNLVQRCCLDSFERGVSSSGLVLLFFST